MSPAAIENQPLPPLVEPDWVQVFRNLRKKKSLSDWIILFELGLLAFILIMIMDNFHPDPFVFLIILGCAILIGITFVITERSRLLDDTSFHLWCFGEAWRQTMMEAQIDLTAPAIESDVVVIRWRTNAPHETLLLGYVSEGYQMKDVTEATQRTLIASIRISATERSGTISRLLTDCKGRHTYFAFFLERQIKYFPFPNRRRFSFPNMRKLNEPQIITSQSGWKTAQVVISDDEKIVDSDVSVSSLPINTPRPSSRELLTFKPSVWGIGIDFKELVRRLRRPSG